MKGAIATAAVAAAFSAVHVSAHAHAGVGFNVPAVERRENEPYYQMLKARYGEAPARVASDSRLERRQATSAAATGGGAPSSAAVSGVATTGLTGAIASSVSMGTIPIGTTTTMGATSPLPTTYAAGATSPVQGAPSLPNVVINPAEWPALDLTPPTDSPQVQQWISQIDWTQVPDIPVSQPGGCQNASNAQLLADAATNGWWTCGGYTRSSDVVNCPQKNTWGLSYDDGPSPDTPRLLQYLENENLKSTFFVVGSRAISRPQMLQYEYAAGHQISVHTWAHPHLTTRTNEQIVAELGWTKEAMRQIIGVTPNTMRPPYGDIDDRVRAISLQMGLRPIIWTSVNGTSYDTFDWQVAGGVVNADTVVNKFEQIINNASSLNTGFIVLEHDLYQQSTSLAVDYVLPYALSHTPKLTLEPIYQCLGQSLSDVYIETAPNNTASAVSSTVDRGSAATSGVGSAAGSGSKAGSGSAAGTTGAASSQVAAPLFASIAAVALAAFAFVL